MLQTYRQLILPVCFTSLIASLPHSATIILLPLYNIRVSLNCPDDRAGAIIATSRLFKGKWSRNDET
ncbi:MAG: hypothetical protein ACE5GZ_06895 [Gammaproteobacteria bacterium]